MADCHVRAGQVRIVDLPAIEQLPDGEQLNSGMTTPPRRVVEPGVRGFGLHAWAGRLEGQEDADLSPFALDHATKVAHIAGHDVAGLDGENDLLRRAVRVVVEIEA